MGPAAVVLQTAAEAACVLRVACVRYMCLGSHPSWNHSGVSRAVPRRPGASQGRVWSRFRIGDRPFGNGWAWGWLPGHP